MSPGARVNACLLYCCCCGVQTRVTGQRDECRTSLSSITACHLQPPPPLFGSLTFWAAPLTQRQHTRGGLPDPPIPGTPGSKSGLATAVMVPCLRRTYELRHPFRTVLIRFAIWNLPFRGAGAAQNKPHSGCPPGSRVSLLVASRQELSHLFRSSPPLPRCTGL